MDGWEGGGVGADYIRCDEAWSGPAPDGWGESGGYAGGGEDCVTSLQLNHQLSQERLSFIHSQSSREDDYDTLPLPAPPPPPVSLPAPPPPPQQVPLPIPPPPKAVREPSPRQESCQHWGSGEESEGEHNNTIRRRSTKRDRNKTVVTSAVGGSSSQANHHTSSHHGTLKKNKARSKSRSPGRELDRAIVIVHHTTCTHSRSRGASPDNLSESSISFHENEVISDISPNAVPRGGVGGVGGGCPPTTVEMTGFPAPPVWYDGPVHPCVSVSRDPPPSAGNGNQGGTESGRSGSGGSGGGRNLQYSNWESCRESWFSSGSDCPRPSSGSDCPPPPSYVREMAEPPQRVPPPHSGQPSTLPRTTSRGLHAGGGGKAACGGTAVRQSSRESGSSSSRQSSRAATRSKTRLTILSI